MKEKIKNSKIMNFLEKHEYGVFLLIVLSFCAIYYLNYTIHNIPYTNGWGNAYADLVFSGKFPYRDFYYYLPPLNLIIDCIFWKLSFGHMFVYVLYRFVERMVIIFLAYNLLCKVSKPRFASIGMIVGAVFFSATVYDLIGDYNQTTILLNLILTKIYLKYVDAANNCGNTKRELKYLLFGGIIIGISFLHKQTIFLAECIIFFIVLTAYFIINHKKGYIKSVLITLLGIIIPITVAVIIFAINGALIPFIDQVYLSVDAKGSVLEIITSFFIACFKWKYIISATVVSLFIYSTKYLEKLQENEGEDKFLNYAIEITFILIIVVLALFIFIQDIRYIKKIFTIEFGLFAAFIILSIILIDYITEKYFKKNGILCYVSIIAIMIISMVFISIKTKYAYTLYRLTNIFSLLTDFTTVATIGGIVLIFYIFYKYYKNKNIEDLKWIILLAGGIAFEYSTAMAARELNNYGLVFLIAVMILYFCTKIFNRDKIIKNFVLVICVIIPIICMSQKVVSAYSWWGWADTMIDSSKFHTIDVPGLEGFRVSEDTKKLYEEMYKVVKSNTNEDSVIYGFPHIRIFNVLLKNTNMNHFVPVPFYDVCADNYMKEDVIRLQQNPPDIVIWIDIHNCLEVHERIFKDNKKLEQRKFIEWFSKSVDNGEYTLIGQYEAMFIYKLNDGTETNYTYYKNKDAVNQTLKVKKHDNNIN